MVDSNQSEMFHKFVEDMNRLLEENSENDGRNQREMIAQMLVLELQFRDTMLSTQHGAKVYDAFVDYVLNVKGNILSAQVFFRERHPAFYSRTNRGFKQRKSAALHKLRINYLFVQWAMTVYKGPNRRKLRTICNRLAKVRNTLVENNLPLAINRAKRFWFKVPESHLQYMDHIQAASEGLVNAVDKFVPTEGVFGGVAIGRMTLNLLTEQNQTLIKLSPKDKRIMYRANTAKNKKNIQDETGVTDYVNEKFRGVSKEDITLLSRASNGLASVDAQDGSGKAIADTIHAAETPESEAEASDLSLKLRGALSRLSVLERKIVRLRNGYR